MDVRDTATRRLGLRWGFNFSRGAMTLPGGRFVEELAAKAPGRSSYATEVVDLILAEARTLGASDVHLQPTADGLEIRWRLDGVLQVAGRLPRGVAGNVVARLKVLAELLTYRTDVPQEGRIRGV